jgi:hypothetical protein
MRALDAAAQPNSWDQMVLVSHYGKATAKGERTITRAEEKGVTEAEDAGHPPTWMVYEGVGYDRSADASAR